MAVQRNTVKPRAEPWGCGEASKAYVNLLTDI